MDDWGISRPHELKPERKHFRRGTFAMKVNDGIRIEDLQGVYVFYIAVENVECFLSANSNTVAF